MCSNSNFMTTDEVLNLRVSIDASSDCPKDNCLKDIESSVTLERAISSEVYSLCVYTTPLCSLKRIKENQRFHSFDAINIINPVLTLEQLLVLTPWCFYKPIRAGQNYFSPSLTLYTVCTHSFFWEPTNSGALRVRIT